MSGKIKEILKALKSHNDIIKEYPLTLSIEEQKLLLDYITNLQEEIEKLNKLISQREKKWEKWTTEKTILSTKMSDYLCKYQNLKREYTKQIKLSTDRKKEVERLNNIINEIYIKALDTSITSLDLRDYLLNRLEGLKEYKGSDKE